MTSIRPAQAAVRAGGGRRAVRADKVMVAGEKRCCGRISQEKGRATCPAFRESA